MPQLPPNRAHRFGRLEIPQSWILMKTLTKNLLLWSTGALILVSPTQLLASTLLIDRGLAHDEPQQRGRDQSLQYELGRSQK